jgi:hypothetical protein
MYPRNSYHIYSKSVEDFFEPVETRGLYFCPLKPLSLSLLSMKREIERGARRNKTAKSNPWIKHPNPWKKDTNTGNSGGNPWGGCPYCHMA